MRKTLTLETGKIARQADACVISNSWGNDCNGPAVTFAKKEKPGQDFFPTNSTLSRKVLCCSAKFQVAFSNEKQDLAEKETLTARHYRSAHVDHCSCLDLKMKF